MFTRIFIGLIITILSFMVVWQTEWIVRQTGSFDWAEKYLGTEGGTRLAVKLIGVLGVVIGLITVTGMHERFMRWILAPLFGPLT
jgi:hypothetical protein